MLCFNFWVNRKDASGPRRLRRRLPRHGQHRSASTATSRCPTAASSSRATAPAGWRGSASRCSASPTSWPARPGLPEHGDQVLRALPLHRPRHDQHGRRGHRPLGRRGPVLLRRRAPDVGREHPASRSTRWWAWCRCSPCTCSRPRTTAGLDRVPRPRRLDFIQHRAEPARERGAGGACRASMATVAALDAARRSAAGRPAADARSRRSSCPTTGSASLSRYHLEHPYVLDDAGPGRFEVKYLPAESDNRLFGGNSNWRGPIWFPVNYVIVRSLARVRAATTATASRWSARPALVAGAPSSEVAADIAGRLSRLFLPDPGPRRAAARLGRQRRTSRPTRTGGTACRSTSTSTATPAPASGRATRRGGRPWSPRSCSSTEDAAAVSESDSLAPPDDLADPPSPLPPDHNEYRLEARSSVILIAGRA